MAFVWLAFGWFWLVEVCLVWLVEVEVCLVWLVILMILGLLLSEAAVKILDVHPKMLLEMISNMSEIYVGILVWVSN